MKYSASITSAIHYLSSQQQENGAFYSLTADNSKFLNAHTSRTPFITSLILSSIHDAFPSERIKECQRKAASFLLSQKSEHWSWNYWERNSSEAVKAPYPDDLDDTFCALTALYQYDQSLISGDVLANIVMQLTALEKKEGGPYTTWLVEKNASKAWHDVDIAVNSNIGYFLSLQDIHLSPLEKFIEKQILKNNLQSPYYVTQYAVIYFIARCYQGKYKTTLQEILLSKKNKYGYWDNPLDTALAVCALLHLNGPQAIIDKAIHYLLRTQRDGHWQAYPFINERITRDHTFFCGSPALTTAFCLEAILGYSKTIQATTTIHSPYHEHEKEVLYSQIMSAIAKRTAFFDTSLVRKGEVLFDKLLKKDTSKQIALLPYYFWVSCHKEQRKKVKKALVRQLGIANTYGWIAYTIYDNFFDKEADDPQLLSLANLALRELTEIFGRVLPGNKKFQAVYTSMLDTIDKANAWEMIACRFDPKTTPVEKISLPEYGDYTIIAEKSIAHCLGPVAILMAMGYSSHSKEMTTLLSYFKHFLIAKQLNDDAHDWETDLLNGQINPANALLLKKWKLKHGKKKNQDISALLPELREFYWTDVISEICTILFEHIEQARKAIKKMESISDPSYLESFLVPSERAAQKAQKESESMISFLKTYQE